MSYDVRDKMSILEENIKNLNSKIEKQNELLQKLMQSNMVLRDKVNEVIIKRSHDDFIDLLCRNQVQIKRAASDVKFTHNMFIYDLKENDDIIKLDKVINDITISRKIFEYTFHDSKDGVMVYYNLL